ncbi:MAG: flavodoxin domain-containing protein [Intestinibacter sp.]
MDKTVIIYKTKYNTTKKYAGWLAIKTNADLYELSDIRNADLKKYDNIIFGGFIENGYIKGIDFIKENYDKIKEKNIIVFYVGLGLYSREEIIKLNFFPYYKYKGIKYFELLGDFDYKKLNFIDKIKINYSNGRISSSSFDFRKKIVNSKKDNLDNIINFLSK